MADTRRLQFIIDAENRIGNAVGQAQAQLDKLQSNIERSADASRKVAFALAGATAALGAFGISALKSAGEMEQTKIAFETMLGSAEKANQLYSDLVKFAAKTPFELKGLETASKQLLAYGFTQEQLLPNLKALGDIASGVGMDKLPNLILAFGQVKAATKLTGMELRQFTEAGVPLLGMLAEQMGKPVSAIQEMVSAGEIGFPAVQQALMSLTGEGGRFNNLMEKQAKSLGGMWSNLQDAWEQFLRGQGSKLLEWGKRFVAMITDIVQNSLPKWIEGIEKIIKFFEEHTTAIYIVAGAIMGALVPAIYSAALAFASAALALAPFLIGGAIIGALVAGIVWIVQNWDMIKAKAMEIWNAITAYLSGIWQSITGAIQAAWNGIKDFFSAIWEGIKMVFQFYVAFMTGLVLMAFQAMGIDLVAVFQTIKEFFTVFWADITAAFQWAVDGVRNVWNTAWNAVRDFVAPIWGSVKTTISEALGWILTKFKEWTAPLTNAWNSLWQGVGTALTTVWEGVKNTIKESINWIIGKVNSVIESINSVARKGAGVIGFSAPQIPTVPMLAEGGIVRRPTLAMIGEAGPEAVVPLSGRFAGAGMGGITIQITGNTFMGEEGIADRIGRDIMRAIKANVRL